MRYIFLFMAALFLTRGNAEVPAQTADDDWPRYRGHEGTGIWHEGPDLDRLSPENIRTIWEMPVYPGYSGPTVAEGRVYVTDYDKNNNRERVLCFDASDGETLWSFEYPCTYRNVGYPLGPRASVIINDGFAYSFGTMGHLYCFDAASGAVVWQHNSLEEYRSRIPIWGLAASPVIEQDLIIVQLGGEQGACLVAFNKRTGEEVWRALDDEASYSPPVVIEQAARRVLVCWTGSSISGLDPETGTVYWSLPFTPEKMIMNVATPVYQEPYLFLSGFFDGSYLVKLNREHLKAEIIYHRVGANERNTDALHCCISTPVVEGDYVYGLDSYGELRCIELLSGDRLWEDLSLVPRGRWANVHFVRQDDKVWGFNELGELLLGKFSRDGYIDLGRAKVIEPVAISPHPRSGVCWSHPAFTGNRIFLRNDEKIMCVEIR